MLVRKESEVFNLNVGATQCKKVLADLVQFGAMHPLILKVVPLEDGSGYYKIIERPLPAIPVKINYKARAIVNGDKIVYDIKEVPFHQLNLEYEITGDKNRSQITLNLIIKSMSFTKKFLANKMIKAQEVIMDKIQDKYGN